MAESMKELLVDQLRDLFSAENQLLKALPRVSRRVTSPMLEDALEKHLVETEEHVARLREVFEILDERPGGKHCAGMEGLIEEAREALEHEADSVRDAAIISAAQRIEHYEMAGYGCVIAFAELLELSDIVSILSDTFDEEKSADDRLSEIAETEVNPQAMLESVDEDEMEEDDNGDDDGEYEEEEEEEEYETADR